GDEDRGGGGRARGRPEARWPRRSTRGSSLLVWGGDPTGTPGRPAAPLPRYRALAVLVRGRDPRDPPAGPRLLRLRRGSLGRTSRGGDPPEPPAGPRLPRLRRGGLGGPSRGGAPLAGPRLCWPGAAHLGHAGGRVPRCGDTAGTRFTSGEPVRAGLVGGDAVHRWRGRDRVRSARGAATRGDGIAAGAGLRGVGRAGRRIPGNDRDRFGARVVVGGRAGRGHLASGRGRAGAPRAKPRAGRRQPADSRLLPRGRRLLPHRDRLGWFRLGLP